MSEKSVGLRDAAQMPEDEWLELRAEVQLGDQGFRMTLPVPASPIRPDQLLPVLQEVTDHLVQRCTEALAEEGIEVSCRAGCGACCRQIVPISHPEGRNLVELVAGLPQPRRAAVLARFRAGAERLLSEEWSADLLGGNIRSARVTADLGLRYFHLGIPCPFLDEESCSIYEDRPLACREYVVTSDPVACADPTPETVRSVQLPARLSRALIRRCGPTAGKEPAWLPMLLALDERYGAPPATDLRPGPEWMTELLREWAGTLPGDGGVGPCPGEPEGRDEPGAERRMEDKDVTDSP